LYDALLAVSTTALLISVPTISNSILGYLGLIISFIIIAIEYASSPLELAALQIRILVLPSFSLEAIISGKIVETSASNCG